MTKTDKFKQAKELYVNSGFAGSQTAEKIGMPETTVYRWIKRYGWKLQRENKLAERKILIMGVAVSVEKVLADYLELVSTEFPQIQIETEKAIDKFLERTKEV